MIETTANQTVAISRRFSAASATYNQHASVHEQVAYDLLAKLSITHPNGILDVGAGTGILTAKVLETFPEAILDAQDLSEELLLVNKSSHPKINCLTGDFNELELSQPYDAIVSSAALHWLNDPIAAIRKMESALKSGGQMAFAVMTENTFPELEEARQFATQKPSRTTLHPVAFWIDACPKLSHEIKQYAITLPSAEAFLRMLHEMGVTAGLTEAPSLTRGELQKLCAYYNEHFSKDGYVTATYEVLHLWSV